MTGVLEGALERRADGYAALVDELAAAIPSPSAGAVPEAALLAAEGVALAEAVDPGGRAGGPLVKEAPGGGRRSFQRSARGWGPAGGAGPALSVSSPSGTATCRRATGSFRCRARRKTPGSACAGPTSPRA